MRYLGTLHILSYSENSIEKHKGQTENYFPLAEVHHYSDTQLSKSLKQQISTTIHHLSVASTVKEQRAIYKQQLAMCSNNVALQPNCQMKSESFSREIGGKRLCFAWCGCFISIYIYSFALHLLCAAPEVCSSKWEVALGVVLAGCCSSKLLPWGIPKASLSI